ncbi:uncharacterized protein [Arachis hypogaea]|uniref:Transposase (putative) gypsy type domain-containing protein n=1 Tax=Arachis hypogaea TaxID=3818 RepID=A0A444YBF5_ARAHY|nr:uncharacterized protein LOC112763006 [Arachis hypogaea]QHN92126.1 uncharacterized protein DS421_17g581000 [Arachis hypogaea]RYQ99278.1 hypothetical protein Ahy_B07g087182 [Arachis hypogaea]
MEKPLVKVVDSDLCSWVDDSVKSFESFFNDAKSVELLGSDVWIREGSDIKIEILSCGKDDRVCEYLNDESYFYVYSCLLTELGVRFSFSEFQCGVLFWLNCAPSQLHPNSWGFVRAFEVLMAVLQQPPSLRVFFSLFQAKGVRRGLWVNLSSHPGRSMFALYKSSFKYFKNMFVKVRAAAGLFPFYLDENLEGRFPISWCPEPNQVLDVEDRLPSEQALLEFLVSEMESRELLSVVELLKWDTDEQAVLDYLGEKVPTITTAGLKLFFNQRKKDEKEGSTTNVPKEVVTGAVQSDLKSRGKRKRGAVKASEAKDEDDVRFDLVESAYESQKVLHGYSIDDHAKSLWSKLFPFMTLAEQFGQFPVDVEMINKVGPSGVSRFLQVIGARLVSIGRTQELSFEAGKKDTITVAELTKITEEKERKVKELTSSLKSQRSELEDARSQQESTNKEISELKIHNEQLVARLGELENEIYESFAQGFDRAVSQMRVLFPDFDAGKLDATKTVVDGKLIDDEALEKADGSSIGERDD